MTYLWQFKKIHGIPMRTTDLGKYMFRRISNLLALLVITPGIAIAQSPAIEAGNSYVQYLANAGFMVVHEETKVVFDPLFRNSWGEYQLLPKPTEEKLFTGEPPFDGIDAVFISHTDGDHFSPEDILRLLKAQPEIQLYAPSQAVARLREVANAQDEEIFERVTAVSLAYKDAPVTLAMEGLIIEAVRIPHSGWPTERPDLENISWRVTLDEVITVLHMGDADPNDVHFERDASYWDKRHVHMAFPPYYFFHPSFDPEILKNRVKADHYVGVHVPVSMPETPSEREPEFRAFDLFKTPGEIRRINRDTRP